MPDNEEPKNKDDYAILVGIDNYLYLDPLKGAQDDIAKFQEWLLDLKGGSVPMKNIHLVLSPPEQDQEDPQPLQEKINQKLKKIGVLNGRWIGRRLYFYFSGHGYGKIDDVGMLMGNASPLELGNNIGLRKYRNFFLEWGFFDEIIFILDCCRDPFQRADTGKPPFTMPDELFPENPPVVNHFTILACAYGRKSYEIPKIADTSNKRQKRGILTLAVLEGLKDQMATDSNGNITASSLSEYVNTRIPQLAGINSLKQDPEFERPLPVREITFMSGLNIRQRIGIFLPKGIDKLSIYDNESNGIADYMLSANPGHWSFNYLSEDVDKRRLITQISESPWIHEGVEGTLLKVDLVQNSWYELEPSQGDATILDLRTIDSNDRNYVFTIK